MSRLRKVVCRALRAHCKPSEGGRPHPQRHEDAPTLLRSYAPTVQWFIALLALSCLLLLTPSLFAQTAALDFGDAPAPYPTLLSANGARHQIVQGIFLGDGVTAEPDGQ